MKTLRYENGVHAGETMTVGELRSALEAYPPEMPVFAEWEGVRAFVCAKGMEVIGYRRLGGARAHPDDCAPSLVIDVNDYW